jgi:hypothetical protein
MWTICGRRQNAYRILMERLKGRRIILKWILNKAVERT